MLVTCGWVAGIMEELAPLSLAEEYDNVGLLLGERDKPVSRLMVALDLLDCVADEAVEERADMVLTHHPLIFRPINRITGDDAPGRRLLKLIKNGVAVYAAHTNLDMARGGTNDVLARLLGLENIRPLGEAGEGGASLGRVGELPSETTLGGLAARLKPLLGLGAVGVAGDGWRAVRRVGLCTGSASAPKYISLAKAAGCDVYITGDVTYHNAQAAHDMGIGLIDATHYGTEAIIVKALKELIEARAAECGASLAVFGPRSDTRVINYF